MIDAIDVGARFPSKYSFAYILNTRFCIPLLKPMSTCTIEVTSGQAIIHHSTQV